MSASSAQHPGAFRRFHEKFLVEQRIVPAAARRNLYLLSGARIAVGLAAFTVILVDVLTRDGISGIDAPLENWLDASRSSTLTTVMIGLAIVFGSIALPLIILVVTVTWGIIARHPWRPLLRAGGTATGVIIMQIVTRVVGRSAAASGQPHAVRCWHHQLFPVWSRARRIRLRAAADLSDLLSPEAAQNCRDCVRRGRALDTRRGDEPGLPRLPLAYGRPPVDCNLARHSRFSDRHRRSSNGPSSRTPEVRHLVRLRRPDSP